MIRLKHSLPADIEIHAILPDKRALAEMNEMVECGDIEALRVAMEAWEIGRLPPAVH